MRRPLLVLLVLAAVLVPTVHGTGPASADSQLRQGYGTALAPVEVAGAPADPHSLLVRFRPGVAPASVLGDHDAGTAAPVPGTGYTEVTTGGRAAGEVLRAMRADPRVLAVEPNYLRRAAAVPNDVYYSSAQASYLEPLRLPAAWDVTTGGDDLVLAVVDSGVDPEQPDLVGRVLPGWDFVDGDDRPDDDFGHGTQVATIAAAAGNNRSGMAGIAWGAQVLPVRVLDDQGVGTDADIAAGITWAADHGADVINLSFGGSRPSQTIANAVAHARARDVVIVSAAGNESRPAPNYPSALDGVVAVSATDHQGNLAWFSNYGRSIDLAAPGVNVLAGLTTGPYQRMQGTSYAAPIVAGVALLARARFPGDSAEAIISRLQGGARDAGPFGIDDYYGYGIVDALGALGGTPQAPRPVASDRHEPDNTPDRASPVGSEATATLAPEGDVDWFFVDVASPRYLTFTVTPPALNSAQRMDAIVELYDPQLRLLQRADQTAFGSPEELPDVHVGAGRHYLRVRNGLPSASSGPYRVRVEPGIRPALPFGFHSVETRSLPGEPASVAVGDLTGDGADDVLVSTASTSGPGPAHELFLLPQGPGGLGPAQSVPTIGSEAGGGDLGLALGDVDGDGDLDAVVATYAGVEIHPQRDGGLVAPALVAAPGAEQVEIGDVDGDQKPDLVVAGDFGLRLLRNRGDGTYDSSAVSSTPVAEVEVADMNSGGRSDIVAFECPEQCTETAVYTSQASGSFSRTSTTDNGGDRFSLGVGDFNRDGRLDIARANGLVTRVLTQQSDGTFPVSHGWGIHDYRPFGVEGSDVDGDGHDDIVVVYGEAGKVEVRGHGDHDLPRPGRFGPKSLAFGDVDGDTLVDIMLADRDHGLVVLRQAAPPVPEPDHDEGEQVWVRDTTPGDGSTNATPAVAPSLRFTRPLDPTTVSADTVTLTDASNGADVPATVRYEPATNSIILQPHQPLTVGHPYLVEATTEVRDPDGIRIPAGAGRFRFLVVTPPGGPAPPPPSGSNPGAAATRSGYWMLAEDGDVYPFGDTTDHGDVRSFLAAGAEAADLEPTPSGGGYWIVDTTGAVFAFGDATYHGGTTAALHPGEMVTSLSATTTGAGYWLFTTQGRALPFGDAEFFGDMSTVALNGPVRDSIPTPTGRGYYMVASDGGIFSFGDARFHGSMGGRQLNAPVQSLVPDPDGTGYWLVAADGGVFSFDALFRGSMGATPLNAPVSGMVPFGDGYLMVGADGGIFNFSDRPFLGSLGDAPPPSPVVAVATLPTQNRESN